MKDLLNARNVIVALVIAGLLLLPLYTSISGIVDRRRPVGPLDLPGAGGGTWPGPGAAPPIRRLDGCTVS